MSVVETMWIAAGQLEKSRTCFTRHIIQDLPHQHCSTNAWHCTKFSPYLYQSLHILDTRREIWKRDSPEKTCSRLFHNINVRTKSRIIRNCLKRCRIQRKTAYEEIVLSYRDVHSSVLG